MALTLILLQTARPKCWIMRMGTTFPQTGVVARGLYGTSAFVDSTGRRILLGWVSGFRAGNGWNGCMSIPRILTLSEEGNIIQTPPPEMEKLRQKHTQFVNLPVNNEFKLINGGDGQSNLRSLPSLHPTPRLLLE